jgi:hypothetical protein
MEGGWYVLWMVFGAPFLAVFGVLLETARRPRKSGAVIDMCQEVNGAPARDLNPGHGVMGFADAALRKA